MPYTITVIGQAQGRTRHELHASTASTEPMKRRKTHVHSPNRSIINRLPPETGSDERKSSDNALH
jgi:hypothetical protein